MTFKLGLLALTAFGLTAVAAPLGSGLVPLTRFDESVADTELAPLASWIGSATWVGLGERVHTSGGFYRAKFRTIRFLVEKMGFRAVAFESGWREAEPAAQFVASCRGSADEATKSLLPFWHDTTVRSFLQWLCDYNRTHGSDPVHFFGVDIQQPWSDTAALTAFLKKVSPATESVSTSQLRECTGSQFSNFTEWQQSAEAQGLGDGSVTVSAQTEKRCLGVVEDLTKAIQVHGTEWTALSSSDEVEEARLSLLSLAAWQKYAIHLSTAGIDTAKQTNPRDEAMAEIAQRLVRLRAPGKKVALWAHSMHVVTAAEEVDFTKGVRWLGGHLATALGNDYFPMGFTAYRTEIEWAGAAHPPIPTNSNAVEKMLHDKKLPAGMLNLDGDLLKSQTPYWLGIDYRLRQVVPRHQLRALVFLEHSPGMEPF